MIHNNSTNSIRAGCKDMWNAFMVNDADFVIGSDIPVCPCSVTSPPEHLISYVNAKHIHKVNRKEDPDYHINAFVHFYIDDQKFDGPKSSIWSYPEKALDVLRHYAGVITPDFSTNADFPDPIKRYNTYRMRAFGKWLSTLNIPVINNVRWRTEETWEYCFDGIPYSSIVSIGTVASGLHKLENRGNFDLGFFEMLRVLNPHTIIVYGSAGNKSIKIAAANGIRIKSFLSDTAQAFLSVNRRTSNE